MNRFLSNATKNIDAKGRVSVPASFRSVMTQLAIEDLYGFQDFIYPAISLGGLDLLDRFEQQINQQDMFSAEPNAMSLLMHGGGAFLTLDKDGRLTISDFIRDHCGLKDQVTFVGRADHFQIWAPDKYQKAREEALSRFRNVNTKGVVK